MSMSARERDARRRVQRAHPDMGGDAEEFRAAKAELDAVREQERQEQDSGDSDWVTVNVPGFGPVRVRRSVFDGGGTVVVRTYTSYDTSSSNWS